MRVNSILSAAAASAVASVFASSAFAQYAGTTNYVGPAPSGAILNSSWATTTNWSTDPALPNATTLVQFPYNNTAFNLVLTLDGNQAAYGINMTNAWLPLGGNASGSIQIDPGTPGTSVLALTSQDTTNNVGSSLATALNVGVDPAGLVTSGGDRLRIRAPIQLGDGTDTVGINYATFVNNLANASLGIESSIRQAAGEQWGLVIDGTRRVELKTGVNSGSYLLNQYELSGGITVKTGAYARLYNNVLHGGDMSVEGTGQLKLSQNSDYIVFGNVATASGSFITSNSGGGRGMVVGADNSNSVIDGTIGRTDAGDGGNRGIPVEKVGTGTLLLSNVNNDYDRETRVSGGTIEFVSVANAGTSSALGRGSTNPNNSIWFNGGTLKYTGSTDSVSNRGFAIGLRNSTLESSGIGSVSIGSGAYTVVTDTATSIGLHNAVADANAAGLLSLNGLASQIANLTVTGGGATNAPISAMNEGAGTMTLGSGTVGLPGSGQGAATFTFTSSVAVDRTLNLTGTNAGQNTLGAPIVDSTLGAKLNIAKSGVGTWKLTGPNYGGGGLVVNNGTLIVDVANVSATSLAGTTVLNNATVTMADTTGLQIGQPVTGANIPAGTVITAITANTSITLSKNATNAGADTVNGLAGGGFGGGGAVVNGGTLIVAEGVTPFTPRQLSSLTVNAGTFDLTNNKVAITTAVEATILAKIIAGRNGGAWNGATGITSSTAAANPSTFGVGYTASGGAATLSYTYLGDANLDGMVDVSDLGILATTWQNAGTWAGGDFNYDGLVDVTDLGSLATNWQMGVVAPLSLSLSEAMSSFSAFNGVSVPEPASLSMLALAGMGLLGRRRKAS